jgi:hypothetical protein
MDKKIFLEKFKKIDETIKALKSKQSNLISEYIKHNTVYPNGTRVRVTNKETGNVEYGIIRGYGMNGSYDVMPVIEKSDRQGKPFGTRLWFFPRKVNIESCND